MNKNAVVFFGFARGKDKVEYLRRYAHGRQVPDHLSIMGSIQIQFVELLDTGIIEVDMDNRVVIGGLKFR